MNNRILAALFALVLILFIGVVPVEAEAAEKCWHLNQELHEYKEVTCTEDGNIKHYKCLDCGALLAGYHYEIEMPYSSIYMKAYGHNYVKGADNHTETCTICKDTKTSEHIDKNATCLCDICAKEMHDLEFVEKKEATCTEYGVEAHYACKNCRRWFVDENAQEETTLTKSKIPATGHTKEWQTDTENHKKVCTTCGKVFYGLTPHDFAKAVDNGDGTHTRECTTCKYVLIEDHADGETANCSCYYCDVELEHVPGEWVTSDLKLHWQICATCGKELADAAEEHAYGYTSNEDGKTHKAACSICGKVRSTAKCYDKDKNCYCDVCNGLMEHDTANMKVVHKEPTCTESGWWLHYECETCGLLLRDGKATTKDDMVRPAKGHDPNPAWSCDDNGHYHRCKVCKEIVTEVLDHVLTYKTNGDGTHAGTCKDCKRVPIKNEKHMDTDNDCACDKCGVNLGHKLVRDEGTAAVCGEPGVKWHYECETCGKFFWDEAAKSEAAPEDVVIEALQHKWLNKGTTLDGKHTQKCENCGKFQTVNHMDGNGDCLCDYDSCGVLAHSHALIHVPAQKATCQAEGNDEYWKYEGCGRLFADAEGKTPLAAVKTYGKTGHDWSGDWTATKAGHSKQCVNCAETQIAEHVDANNDFYCDECGAADNLVYVAQVNPTCTDKGYKGYWVSTVTGRKYADEAGAQYISAPQEIPALGHNLGAWIDNGQGGHERVCGNGCGYKLTGSHSNKVSGCFCDLCYARMPGHELTKVASVKATCVTAGYKAFLACSCGNLFDEATGEKISEPVVIPAYGHRLSADWIKDAEEGDHYKYCLNAGCNAVMRAEHAPVLEDPLKGNYHQWICVCGDVKTEKHFDNNGDSDCDECGHDMANTSVKVEQHDSVTVVTGNKDTVDNGKSWWQNWVQNMAPSNAGGVAETKPSVSSTTPSTSTSNDIGVFFQWLSQLFGGWM